MTTTTSSVPTLPDWAAMSWRARQEWCRRHGVSLTDANLAVARAHVPMRGRQTRQIDGWSDAEHLASLAGDRDPDTVLARRAAATGMDVHNPRLMDPDPYRRSHV